METVAEKVVRYRRERDEAESEVERLTKSLALVKDELASAIAERDWYWVESEKYKCRNDANVKKLRELEERVRQGRPPRLNPEPRKAHRGRKKKKETATNEENGSTNLTETHI